MEKCPKCGEYSIAYDGYRREKRCMIDGCSCVVIDNNSYSFLKPDPSNKTMNVVKVEGGEEREILKKYKMF